MGTLILPAHTYLTKYLHSLVYYSLLLLEETTGEVLAEPGFCVHWMSQGDMEVRQRPDLSLSEDCVRFYGSLCLRGKAAKLSQCVSVGVCVYAWEVGVDS